MPFILDSPGSFAFLPVSTERKELHTSILNECLMKPACQNQTRLQEIGRDQRFVAKCQAQCNSYFHNLKKTGQCLKKFMCTIKLLFVYMISMERYVYIFKV